MRPAVKVAIIAGASRHSRLETEPKVLSDSDKTCELLIIQEKQCYFLYPACVEITRMLEMKNFIIIAFFSALPSFQF